MSIAALGPAPYTWDLLDVIGDDGTGNRYELVDGGLAVSPPPGSDHDVAAAELLKLLAVQAPAWTRPVGPVGIDLGAGDCRIPDVAVLRRDAPLPAGPLPVSAVLLVVEVESPGSRTTDRITKPVQYAAAGIASYWRLMIRDTLPTLLAYELVDAAYVEVVRAEGHEEVTVPQPFPVTICPADLLR